MGLNLSDRVGPGGHRILTIGQPPQNRSQLPGIEQNTLTAKLTPLQLMELDLYVAAKAEMERKRRVEPERLLTKQDASRALGQALAAQYGRNGGAQ